MTSNISKITKAVVDHFPCFGGKTSSFNPLRKKSYQFSVGVDVREVVKFILREQAKLKK